MPRPKRISPELLEAALAGLEQQRAEVDRNIAEVKKLLRSGRSSPGAEAQEAPARRPRRKMTATAKKRIAEAQRKRWAAFRAQEAAAKRPRKKGRKRAKKAAAPETA
jgi:hypothetical protein